MTFVLDSSIALTWCFEDEATPEADALLERITEGGAHAPALWPLEVLNVLCVAERRGRITNDTCVKQVVFLHHLPITLDHETADQAWLTTSSLARTHKLTVYDAAYLELAQRLDLPLATLDKELREAATRIGLPLLGLAT